MQVEGLLVWDNDDPVVTTIQLRDNKPPIYDLVLQQAFAQILINNNNEPTPIKITIEELCGNNR